MEIDPRFVGAITTILPKAIEIAKGLFSEMDQTVEYSIRQAHYDYACAIIRKYSRSKTFFVRAEPVDLYDFYVPASVEDIYGQRRTERADIPTLRNIGKNVIISGSAGSGKTIFMRHLLLNALLCGSVFPILVELRNLNDDPNKTIEGEILEILRSNGFNLDTKFVHKSLTDGLFVVLLDGFDEVQFARRPALQREIKKLSTSLECQLIITSRPDVSLQSWDRFTNLKISSLTLDEACQLVEKIRFDDDIKGRFLKSLRSGVFESHRFFLSNPLLLSIMLLTYGDSADIPKRQSSFYMQAYEALFQQHDALKSGFKRDRKTDLDIYEFSRLFSGFSIVSYRERAFQFLLTDAIKYARKAGEVTGINRISYEGFIDDARQAVCLLLEDGLHLAFAHRSFQEFFAAKFIAEAEEIVQKKIIDGIVGNKSPTVGRDNVIGLLHEISPPVVERYYLAPKLALFFGKNDKRRVSKKFWFEKFQHLFNRLQLHEGDGRLWLNVNPDASNSVDLISFVQRKYLSSEFDRVEQDQWLEESEKFVRKHFKEKQTILETKEIAFGTQMADDLSKLFKPWSPEGFEKVREALKEIRQRALNRSAAINKVFSL